MGGICVIMVFGKCFGPNHFYEIEVEFKDMTNSDILVRIAQLAILSDTGVNLILYCVGACVLCICMNVSVQLCM